MWLYEGKILSKLLSCYVRMMANGYYKIIVFLLLMFTVAPKLLYYAISQNQDSRTQIFTWPSGEMLLYTLRRQAGARSLCSQGFRGPQSGSEVERVLKLSNRRHQLYQTK